MNIHSLHKIRIFSADLKRWVIKKLSRNSTDKYNLILNAAIKVFAENGFFYSTVSQIAREAGVADGTIYLYFKSKEDILLQFFNRRTQEVFERFRTEAEKAGNAREKLVNLIRRHLEEFQHDRAMAIVFQSEARVKSRLNGRLDKYVKELSKKYMDLVGEIIELGQAEGSIRKDVYISLAKRLVLGSVDEVISTWVNTGGHYDMASMAEPLVDLYFKGIGSTKTAAVQ
jgi:TetR/AcrR family fatty acid metabolism transcriptional regulator